MLLGGAPQVLPALLIRMSMRPYFCSTASTIAGTVSTFAGR
jgi:hypothetical protein